MSIPLKEESLSTADLFGYIQGEQNSPDGPLKDTAKTRPPAAGTKSETLDRNQTEAPGGERVALKLALDKSQEVKEKVEECVVDLGSTNVIVKKNIAAGSTTLSAHKVLADSESIESKVQECADDLSEVNETLVQGIDGLERTEIALTKSQDALAVAEAAVATAQEGEETARLCALHDSATGLPNRNLFDDRLEQAISLAKRHDWTLAVMFLDLDSFKSINDTHGHAAGDAVLKEVAKRLARHARDEDTVCRSGGDEFLFLLMNPQGRENIERIAGVVLKSIARPIDIGDTQLVTKSSIGIAVYPGDGTTGEQLIANADAAMYRAKRGNRGYAFL